MINTKDGGYLIGGRTGGFKGGDRSQSGIGFTDYWIVKTDSNGRIIWERTFGGYKTDIISVMLETSDQGFLLGGTSDSPVSVHRSSTNKGGRDFWLVKIDSVGNYIWDKSYGGEGDDRLSTIVKTPDGGYLLGGSFFFRYRY